MGNFDGIRDIFVFNLQFMVQVQMGGQVSMGGVPPIPT